MKTLLFSTALALMTMGLAGAPASALTMKECSTKYQDAKKANTLKGQKWNDFRKANCADDDASENDAAAAVTDAPAPAATPAATTAGKPAAATPAKPAGKAKAAVFPRAVAPKYSDETAGRARLKTCADQYNANKAANANGELKWIEKGGGYWSQCNAKLKG
ncbi:hypothetical protein ACWIGM_06710 [Bosea sp. NPDC055332]